MPIIYRLVGVYIHTCVDVCHIYILLCKGYKMDKIIYNIIYMYMCIHTYRCIYVYVYAYTHTYIFTYVYII